jgi:hypothetical protein
MVVRFNRYVFGIWVSQPNPVSAVAALVRPFPLATLLSPTLLQGRVVCVLFLKAVALSTLVGFVAA